MLCDTFTEMADFQEQEDCHIALQRFVIILKNGHRNSYACIVCVIIAVNMLVACFHRLNRERISELQQQVEDLQKALQTQGAKPEDVSVL